jgi:hypothetical protein
MTLFGTLALLACSTLTLVFGESNVYGNAMTDCGPDHASGCTYTTYDAGAHEVCVTKLPHGFSSETGQGPWSDEFTGQPWCICIWAYSNYILQNKDLSLKCESIPAKVLEERYSLDKFQQCGSMSSTQGCGPEDIRRSIQSLCQQCDAQAPDEDGRAALKNKCDAILESAPAAPMQRLFMDHRNWKAMSVARNVSPYALVVCGFVFVAASLAMLARTLQRRSQVNSLIAVE